MSLQTNIPSSEINPFHHPNETFKPNVEYSEPNFVGNTQFSINTFVGKGLTKDSEEISEETKASLKEYVEEMGCMVENFFNGTYNEFSKIEGFEDFINEKNFRVFFIFESNTDDEKSMVPYVEIVPTSEISKSRKYRNSFFLYVLERDINGDDFTSNLFHNDSVTDYSPINETPLKLLKSNVMSEIISNQTIN